MNAPYLDTHGEVDVMLKYALHYSCENISAMFAYAKDNRLHFFDRRGRPQFLNQKRYDEFRKLWLTHSVAIHVARKLEQTFDLGGWTTM
jgi:hypothetical protein